MGRRTKWEEERRPTDEKLVEIVSRADYRGVRFGDIVYFAGQEGISRAAVARHLDTLVDDGILKKDGGYKLAKESINWRHAQMSVFSILSMHLFDDVFERAGQRNITDEEFVKLFTSRVGVLALYTMLVGLEKASKNGSREGGKWIEEAFGTLTQKDGWRSCLVRQVFGGVVKLKAPIRLGEPLMPEIIVEDDTIYVRPPSAIQTGFAGKVLGELPKIPEDRLDLLRTCLKKLYPSEIELLDDAVSKINMAVSTSKKRGM